GTRRLAADVDEHRALLEEASSVRDGCRGLDERAPVGEAVGCDVDDAHDGRPGPALLERHAAETSSVWYERPNRPSWTYLRRTRARWASREVSASRSFCSSSRSGSTAGTGRTRPRRR